HGFFPRGGAELNLEIYPRETSTLKPLELLELPKPAIIKGISVASESLARANVADRQARAATTYLTKQFPNVEIDVKSYFMATDCPGSGISLWIENEQGFSTMGASDFGARGKSSEIVGKNAARLLIKDYLTGAAVDSHAVDQLIPYMACAAAICSQESRITASKMTLHAETNIEISKKFFPDLEFKVISENQHYLIICSKK
ncbi:MAG: RNA 3'-terminal phosphate cyclase, partial [Candidatus Odinarchaeota archaeon]